MQGTLNPYNWPVFKKKLQEDTNLEKKLTAKTAAFAYWSDGTKWLKKVINAKKKCQLIEFLELV